MGWFRKREKTLQEQFASIEGSLEGRIDLDDDGEREWRVYGGEEPPAPEDVEVLDMAILSFLAREYESIEKIDDYFNTHTALSVENHFRHWAYEAFSGYDGVDAPYKGLCILLLEKAKHLETLKFAMLLARFFDVFSAPRARELITSYGRHPAMTYYAILVYGEIPRGQGELAEIGRTTYGRGKDFIATYVRRCIES